MKIPQRILLAFGLFVLVASATYLLQGSASMHTVGQSQKTTTTFENNIETKAGAQNLYPDSRLTPGAVLTTNKEDVCRSGYAKRVRNVPKEEKRHVYSEYDVSYPQPQGDYEVDHFIPLELGGSNDIKNLWPEPANPTPGFHQKDKVEDYLHEQVCSEGMNLEEAQREIATDWYRVYLKIQS